MKIFVGNIAQDVSNSDLENLFLEFGDVERVEIILDKFTGESRKFGFVHMGNKEEAKSAIAGLHGKHINGTKLVVNQARNRIEKRDQGNRRSGPPHF